MNTNVKLNRSIAMREANFMVKSGEVTRADAMRKGTMLAKLYAIFAVGAAASISFIKADGTLREATALPSAVGENLVKGTGNPTPKANVLFCDADLGGAFRSFRKVTLVSVSVKEAA